MNTFWTIFSISWVIYSGIQMTKGGWRFWFYAAIGAMHILILLFRYANNLLWR